MDSENIRDSSTALPCPLLPHQPESCPLQSQDPEPSQLSWQWCCQDRQRFFDLSLELLCKASFDGYFLQLNPMWVKTLGFDLDFLLTTPYLELVHPDDRTATQQKVCHLHEGRPVIAFENRYRCRDGQYRWLSWMSMPVPEDGVIYATARDVTDRKKQDDWLALMERAISYARNGIIITDATQADNPAIYVNPAVSRMTGYTPDEILGHNCRLFQGHDRQQVNLAKVSKSVRQGQDCEVVLRNYRRDGSLFWNELHIAPVYDEKQNLTHFIGIQSDITSQKQAEAELFNSELNLRMLINTMADGLLVVNQVGKILFVNPAAEQLLGQPQAELLDQDFGLPFVDNSGESHQNNQRTVVEIRNPSRLLITEMSTAQITWQEQPAFLISLRDVTDRREAEAALQASEQFLRNLFNNIEEYIAVLEVVNHESGPEFYYYNINPAFESVTRLATEQIRGKSPAQVFSETLAQSFLSQYRACLHLGERMTYEECVVLGGKTLWWLTSLTPLHDQNHRVYRIISSSINLTNRKQTEIALRHSEHRYRQIVETATEGIWVLDQHYYTSFVNQQAAEMLGYRAAEMLGQPFFKFVAPESFQKVRNHLQQCQVIQNSRQDVRFQKRDQTPLWTILSASPLLDEWDQYVGVLIMLTDITERWQIEAKMREMALYDSLTQLPNRTFFLDRLNHVLQRCQRQLTQHFAVLFLDLDRFKVVNDSLGHSIGDQLLIAFSRLVESLLHPSDTFARLGGDEFTILLEDLSCPQDAYVIAERINQVLAQPFHLEGAEIFTSTSIGIAFGQTGLYSAEMLLRDADTAMYRAKSKGRGCYAVFDTVMHQEVLERLHLEVNLRHAIQRQEMRVFYQPIVCLQTGQLQGFEALLRWFPPEGAMISPDQFIPIAEETGLITELGHFVLREACFQTQEWHRLYPSVQPLIMGVNLSSKQLSQFNLVPFVLQILAETGLTSQQLKLEITETCLMENPELAASKLHQLEQAGIQLALDDFGTGYSSLNYLRRFPVHTLKIDRSFVSRLDYGGEDLEIIRTIVALAHNLKMNIIAEGIETLDQWQKLLDLGCEFGQGYFFAQPLAQADAEALVAQNGLWPLPSHAQAGSCMVGQSIRV
ncbi:MAG: PAS domain S-box protein [Prochlorothrix sp.]|nr:PAS domain S-box protein [Prochlorothrix sp.]